MSGCRHDDDCDQPADVEVLVRGGEWEPWCEPHAHSVPAYRVREITRQRSSPRVWSCCGAPHSGSHLDICPQVEP